jgi:hypothetical protein
VIARAPPPVLEPEPEPAPPPEPEAAAPAPRVEAPPTEPAAKAAPTIGYLEVHANPWAWVIVDGKQLEEDAVGVKKVPLKPGKHVVVLKHPSFEKDPETVQIKAGKSTRVDFTVSK